MVEAAAGALLLEEAVVVEGDKQEVGGVVQPGMLSVRIFRHIWPSLLHPSIQGRDQWLEIQRDYSLYLSTRGLIEAQIIHRDELTYLLH